MVMTVALLCGCAHSPFGLLTVPQPQKRVDIRELSDERLQEMEMGIQRRLIMLGNTRAQRPIPPLWSVDSEFARGMEQGEQMAYRAEQDNRELEKARLKVLLFDVQCELKRRKGQ